MRTVKEGRSIVAPADVRPRHPIPPYLYLSSAGMSVGWYASGVRSRLGQANLPTKRRFIAPKRPSMGRDAPHRP
jgi:hypothetical protein